MVGRIRSFDRDAALATAVELFWRWGYEETTISMLTNAMGVTPSSLYAAFGDKDALFAEASGAYFRRTSDAIAVAAARPRVHDAIAVMLEQTALAHTGTQTPRGCLLLTDPKLDEQRAAIRHQLHDRLARGIAEGDLPETADPERLASFLLAVMRGMSGCARDGGTTEDLRAIAGLALAAIDDGATPVR